MWRYILLVLYVATATDATTNTSWVVNITQGPVRGYMESDGVYAFYNIPYATAPTGENKFQAPLSPPTWTDTFDAVDAGIICPQADFDDPFVQARTEQEDCLIVNVYVPSTDAEGLAVVVYIHGGAFQVGYGDWRKAKTLMENQNMIVVTFNYRLGIHGFLCLGTTGAPGNAGMKDMVALLNWVNTNIASFGGNPSNVTISGYSAGGSAADLLILSKSAEGLFQKVIVESGSSDVAFAIQPDPLQNAKDYALTLNFTDVDDIDALDSFYRNLSYSNLTTDNFMTRKDSTALFSPCVELNTTGVEVFIADTPTNILKGANYTKVPMLYGFTNKEGLMREGFFDVWKASMDDNFTAFLPPDLTFASSEEKAEVAVLVKEYYFGSNTVASDILGYVNYFTDIMFTTPALRSITLNVKGGNDQIYLFYYTYTDENDAYIGNTTERGAFHCAESQAIFDDFQTINATTNYTNLRTTMREMWRNFILTGKPVGEDSSLPCWPATCATRTPHMILNEEVELAGVLLEDNGTFWDAIYEAYYREPIAPTTNTTSK